MWRRTPRRPHNNRGWLGTGPSQVLGGSPYATLFVTTLSFAGGASCRRSMTYGVRVSRGGGKAAAAYPELSSLGNNSVWDALRATRRHKMSASTSDRRTTRGRAPRAARQSPVRGRPVLEPVVTFEGGHKHLPVVTLWVPSGVALAPLAVSGPSGTRSPHVPRGCLGSTARGLPPPVTAAPRRGSCGAGPCARRCPSPRCPAGPSAHSWSPA